LFRKNYFFKKFFGSDFESIDEIRSQRDEMSTLMAGISDAILAIDLDEKPLFYNTQFVMMVGNDKMKEGNTILSSLMSDADILHAFRFTIIEKKPFNLRAVSLTQNNLKKFYSLSVSPLRKPNREVYGAVGIFHDVTELMLAEQMRIDFIANVSHELRTPLTSIKGYADTVVSDLELGKVIDPQFLQVIQRNSDRLMLLIKDLLDLSTMDSGIDHLNKEKISTSDLTYRVIEQLKLSLESKNHQVHMECLTPYVYGDLKRIEQVLVNLLDNASKYTPSGIEITVRWETDSSQDVFLRVMDKGPGIQPEHHDRLFDRFYRVDKARARDQGGTGLGLAIVKNIMQRHGGAVWVDSVMGEGAVFSCQFPHEEKFS
jgi:two-component system phosphate regulon sensor histidine kinase PhoR